MTLSSTFWNQSETELIKPRVTVWVSIHGRYYFVLEDNLERSWTNQFSSVPWQIGSSGEHEGRFSGDPLPVFSAGGRREQFWHGQGCPLFDFVHPPFPLSTTAWPTLQGVLKDGFGESVVAIDMPEPCKFPSFDTVEWESNNNSDNYKNSRLLPPLPLFSPPNL